MKKEGKDETKEKKIKKERKLIKNIRQIMYVGRGVPRILPGGMHIFG